MLTQGEENRLEAIQVGDNHVLLQVSRCEVGGSADIEGAEGLGLLVTGSSADLKLRRFLHSRERLGLVQLGYEIWIFHDILDRKHQDLENAKIDPHDTASFRESIHHREGDALYEQILVT